MFTKLATAATALAVLAAPVPVAYAGVIRSGCVTATGSNETLTGGEETYTGAMIGYVAFDDSASHTMRCYVTVDGSEVASTPTGAGIGVVVTAGQVTYYGAEGSLVEYCIEIDGVTNFCTGAIEVELPPQPVLDVLEPVLELISGVLDESVSPVICPVLAALAPGVPGLVDIYPTGDVVAAGVFLYDCPPSGLDIPRSGVWGGV